MGRLDPESVGYRWNRRLRKILLRQLPPLLFTFAKSILLGFSSDDGQKRKLQLAGHRGKRNRPVSGSVSTLGLEGIPGQLNGRNMFMQCERTQVQGRSQGMVVKNTTKRDGGRSWAPATRTASEWLALE